MRTNQGLSALILAGVVLFVAAPSASQQVAKRATKRAAKEATKSAAEQAAEEAAKKAAQKALAPDAVDLNTASAEQLTKLGLDEARRRRLSPAGPTPAWTTPNSRKPSPPRRSRSCREDHRQAAAVQVGRTCDAGVTPVQIAAPTAACVPIHEDLARQPHEHATRRRHDVDVAARGRSGSDGGLDDEEAVKQVLNTSVMGLWQVVNTLTRLRPSKRERYRVAIFGSARAQPGTFVYDEVKRVAAAAAGLGCDIVTGGGPGVDAGGQRGCLHRRRRRLGRHPRRAALRAGREPVCRAGVRAWDVLHAPASLRDRL